MKNWMVSFAYRKDGKYCEDTLSIVAASIDGVLREANVVLNIKAYESEWDTVTASGGPEKFVKFVIWDIGIVADADEEVI